MALVSPSVPIHMRQPLIERRPSPRRLHWNSSSHSSSNSLPEIEEDQEEEEMEKVYVAVGKEYKESKETVIWVLQNVRDKKVVLVHVHKPAQMIPIMGAKFKVHQLKEEHVRAYRQTERQKVDEMLDEYLALCSHSRVQAETLVIEMDDVSKGLVKLITEHGITKLVMGAAADRAYTRKMKAPKSKTAINVQQYADPTCNIWFVCKGHLICIRDTSLDGSEVAGSPTASLNSSRSLNSHQLRTRSLHQRPNEDPRWVPNLTQRSMSEDYNSQAAVQITELIGLEIPVNRSPASSTSVEGSGFDPWEGIGRNSQASDHSTWSASDEVISNNDPPTLPRAHDSEEDLQLVAQRIEMEDIATDNEVYEKLEHALKMTEDSVREAYKESCRRRKAERDAMEVARKVKAAASLYSKELRQRKETEAASAREMLELEKLRAQNNDVIEELQNTNEKRREMELQIAQSEKLIKEFQEKLSAAKSHLSSLHREHEELQREREGAVREVEEFRQKGEEASTSTQRAISFAEFRYSELQEATNNFADSMKIGEGGYGSVYKGFLRHTMVAIKLLNPESKQGVTEFYQEVEILSWVRHPHLVTLIGKCPEAYALIYEFLPQGSLEDHLSCKNNTAPLPWHVRTRICAEICSALIFLHSFKPHTVVHGDIKPANILLDSNFTCKLGDFGIGRLLVQSNTTTTLYHKTIPKGTFAYIDPEFLSTGELTPRSDIYSFGVIILRLLTGIPALGIINKVREAVEGGWLHEILDASAGGWPFVQAKQLAHLALKCCEINRKNRPDLAKEAWRVLEPMTKVVSSIGSPSNNNCIPSYFICPIFLEIMSDPHIAADGYTYEAEAIKGWLHGGYDTSPMTNRKLAHNDLVPNLSLRSAIQEWLHKYK